MRILQLSSARHFGGGERHFADLTNALARRGHAVFAALASGSPLRTHLHEIPDSQIIQLPLRNSIDLPSVVRLKGLLRDLEVDVIHAHVGRDYPLAALAVGRSGPAKLVITRHVLFPMGGLHRLTRRRVARVIAVSEAVANALRRQRIFRDTQITVVRHGIDVKKFRPDPEAISGRAPGVLRIGMMGELSPVKNQKEFVRAAAIVAAQRDDVDFVIAGEDRSANGENRRELETVIGELGLAERVRLAGHVDKATHFLSGLDVFVSASTSESFGLAMIEAMACGVPVVATDTEGAREIIELDQNGVLVPRGNVEELARAIEELCDDNDRRKLMSANAEHSAKARYSLERMVDETEEIYREVSHETAQDY